MMRLGRSLMCRTIGLLRGRLRRRIVRAAGWVCAGGVVWYRKSFTLPADAAAKRYYGF